MTSPSLRLPFLSVMPLTSFRLWMFSLRASLFPFRWKSWPPMLLSFSRLLLSPLLLRSVLRTLHRRRFHLSLLSHLSPLPCCRFPWIPHLFRHLSLAISILSHPSADAVPSSPSPPPAFHICHYVTPVSLPLSSDIQCVRSCGYRLLFMMIRYAFLASFSSHTTLMPHHLFVGVWDVPPVVFLPPPFSLLLYLARFRVLLLLHLAPSISQHLPYLPVMFLLLLFLLLPVFVPSLPRVCRSARLLSSSAPALSSLEKAMQVKDGAGTSSRTNRMTLNDGPLDSIDVLVINQMRDDDIRAMAKASGFETSVDPTSFI